MVVIAAYNEATVIGGVVAGVVRAGYRAVVVDDGSRDDTGAQAAARRRRRRHPSDQSRPGRGAADRHRLRAARTAPTPSSPSTPTASTAPPRSPACSRRLRDNDADFALGSRFLGHAVNLSAARRLVLTAATAFTRFTTGLTLTDTHNGLRAMTARGAAAISLRQDRMAHASEILAPDRRRAASPMWRCR